MSRKMKVLLALTATAAIALICLLGARTFQDAGRLAGLRQELAVSRASWEKTAEEKEALQEELKALNEELREAELTLEESVRRAEELRQNIAELREEIHGLENFTREPDENLKND